MAGLRLWLVIAALLTGALLGACGGGGDENGDGDGATEQPAATTVADGDADGGDQADANGGDGVDAGGASFGDVPVPAGADERSSGTFTGTDFPLVAPGGDIDPEAYTNIEFREYAVDASPDEVIDFYRSELSGWEEVFVFSGGADDEGGGIGVWTRDDGRTAVWVTTGTANGGTELIVIVGTQE